MYTDFYNLKEPPFNLTPSPRFLYLGESHKEALAFLTYGVVERKGFILLTGDVGTGKTTMVQALLSNLNSSVQYVYVSNPLLSPNDFMNYVASSAFKEKVHFRSKADFLLSFEEFLRQCLQQQKNFILIIDEAQRLSFELLEEIRLLSNMEYADEKLINIFLVGQPELQRKLTNPRCRPLLQRISSRYHIPPLDFKDTRDYVATRLRIAGARNGADIFSKGAIKAIHRCSMGYPRVINILADQSMLLGYSQGKRKITDSMVKECHEDISLNGPSSKNSRKPSEPSEIREVAQIPGRFWKWAAALVFVIAIVAVGISQRGWDILRGPSGVKQASHQVALNPVGEVTEEQLVEEKKDLVNRYQINEQVPPDIRTEEREEEPKEMRTLPQKEDKGSFESVVVKRGDTLIQLAAGLYGRADDHILKMVQRHNPEIEDVNRIRVGQELTFPRLPLSDLGSTFTVHIASFGIFESARNLFEQLRRQGYHAHILRVHDPQRGTFYRVTLGNFKSSEEAEDYAATVLDNGIFGYAKPIQR